MVVLSFCSPIERTRKEESDTLRIDIRHEERRLVYQYWTNPYITIPAPYHKNPFKRDDFPSSHLKFFLSAHIDDDRLVVENLVFMKSTIDWNIRRLGGSLQDVEGLLWTRLDVGGGYLDARIPLSPAEVFKKVSPMMRSYSFNERSYWGGGDGVPSEFCAVHCRTYNAHLVIRSTMASWVGREVPWMGGLPYHPILSHPVWLSLEQHRRRGDLAFVPREYLWTEADQAEVERRLDAMSLVRRVEVTW